MPSTKYPQLNDKEWLRRKYEDERLSTTEIAEIVGATAMTVHRRLVQHDIRRRPAGQTKRFAFPELQDRDWLFNAYVNEQKSYTGIAADLRCTDSAVQAAMRRLDIPRRSALESRQLRGQRYREALPLDTVKERYAAGEGFDVIGKDFGVTGHFIRKVLVENGVAVRTKAEQTKIELARRHTRDKMLAKARERQRPTGVRGLKAAIKTGTCCSFCGTEGPLQQHHLNAVRSDDRPENLAPLCDDCHRKVEWFIGCAVEGLSRAYRRELRQAQRASERSHS